MLKPELSRAIVDCGFEHPSEGSLWQWLVVIIICNKIQNKGWRWDEDNFVIV